MRQQGAAHTLRRPRRPTVRSPTCAQREEQQITIPERESALCKQSAEGRSCRLVRDTCMAVWFWALQPHTGHTWQRRRRSPTGQARNKKRGWAHKQEQPCTMLHMPVPIAGDSGRTGSDGPMSIAAAPSGSFSSETRPSVSRGRTSNEPADAGTAAPPALPSEDTAAAAVVTDTLSSSLPTAVGTGDATTAADAVFCFPLGCKGTFPRGASGSRPSRISRLRSISSCCSYCKHATLTG